LSTFAGTEIQSPNSGDSTEGMSPVEAVMGAAVTVSITGFLEEGQILATKYREA
jgi:hypothetical protein